MNPKSNENASKNSSNSNNASGGHPSDANVPFQSTERALASVPKDRYYFEIPFVASLLQCSRRHVFRLIDSGSLPNCVDISSPDSSRKMLRIPRHSIEAYLKKNNF